MGSILNENIFLHLIQMAMRGQDCRHFVFFLIPCLVCTEQFYDLQEALIKLLQAPKLIINLTLNTVAERCLHLST